MSNKLIKSELPQDLAENWYQILLKDLTKIEFGSVVLGKLAYGNRILKDFEKFKQGEKRVENIAKDLKVSPSEVYNCIKFAEKVRDNSEFSNNVRKLWIISNFFSKFYTIINL